MRRLHKINTHRPGTALKCILFFIPLVFLAHSVLAQSLDIKALRTNVQVKRNLPVTGASQITMQAMQNGHDGFQLVVHGNGNNVNNIQITVEEDLVGKNGRVLPKSHLTLFREIYLYVTTPTGMHPENYPEGEVADPLLPLSTTSLPDNAVQTTPFSLRRVGATGKSYLSQGDGGCFAGGAYEGTTDRHYVIEIDKAGELGSATFRWSDQWDGNFGSKPYSNYATEPKIRTWQGMNIPTSEGEVALNHGVTVRFTGGKQVVGNERKSYGNISTSNYHVGDRYYFNVYNNFNEVVWGEVHVPAETMPGNYTGKLTVTADGAASLNIPIDLRVYGVQIPKNKSMDSAYGRMIDPVVYHRGTPRQMKIIGKRYEEMLHDHRIDYEMFNVIPDFHFAGDRLVSTDWRQFDAIAGPRLDGSYWNDGVGMRRFTFDFGWLHPGYTNKNKMQIMQIAKETAAHLKENGWFDKSYIYCLDEAGERLFPLIKEHIEWIVAGDTDWRGKFMITAPPTRNNILLDSINIWCVPTFKFDNWSDYGKNSGTYLSRADYRRQIIEQGNSFWLYVANYPTSGPYMSYQLDRLNLHEPRLLKWASWYEGATGFLFWATTGSNAAVPNPYLNPWYTEGYSRDGKSNGINGDSFLVYPGDRNGAETYKYASGHGLPFPPVDGPLPSIRLKQIRDGFEDWEMFLLAEKKGFGEQTRREVGLVYQRLGGTFDEYQQGKYFWKPDPVLMWNVRERIATQLENR